MHVTRDGQWIFVQSSGVSLPCFIWCKCLFFNDGVTNHFVIDLRGNGKIVTDSNSLSKEGDNEG